MFHLRDALSSAEFGGRVNDVFAALGTGSVKTPDTQISRLPKHFEDQQIERSTKVVHEKGVDQRKGEFKHPAEFLKPDHHCRGNKFAGRGRGRGGRGRYVPDHKKNPGKWTKYSLADVDTMTDKSNSAAAFDFLNTIKSRKKGNEELMETEEPAADHKPIFKRPPKKKTLPTAADKQSGGSFVGAKHVLPEYVVGAATAVKKTEKKVSSTSKGAGNALRLSHLDEEEED